MRLVSPPSNPTPNEPTPESLRVQRLPEVESVCGIKRSQIYTLMAAGKFPRPVKLSERAVGWRARDVAAWLSSREAV